MASPRILSVALITCWASLTLVPRQSAAQAVPGVPVTGGPAAFANPYANPYLNPFLNPFAAQTSMGRRDALYYLFAAQSANGGLGSGQLSGVRPGPATAGRRRPAADMPLASDVPGRGAARYFQRGPNLPQSRGAYFQRHNRYFASNGR
jgi:hypothetical protein